MTSVDSGVETGNDSNDSSIVQHENLGNNQMNGTAGSTVATNTANNSREKQEDPGTFRIEFGPVWPVDLHLPLPSLYPVLENQNNAENSQNSAASTSGPVMVSTKVLQYWLSPVCGPNRITPMDLLKKRSCCHRKIKSLHSTRRNHCVTWIDVQGPLIERKMRLAAATNNTIMMRRLLSTGVSPNTHDDQGRTPLHLASCRGYTEMVRILLEHGADPNQRDGIGNTPLHLAAITSKISVVTLLLKAGTDVMSLDRHGYNPLQLAQTKLKMLQNCKGADMLKVKEEVHNVVSMLLTYLQKQKDTCEQVETLSTFCSRLSLSNTSDQVQDDVKDLLANIDALTITS